MPPETFELSPLFDYAATLIWATTGALMAARRGYDLVGVLAIAFVSASGGGLVRDGLFLQQGPPAVLRSPVYLGIVLGAGLTVQLFGRTVQRLERLATPIALFDALGVGVFAVVGMQLALATGVGGAGAVLVGCVNAVGGGVLRDLLLNREPELFKPGTLLGSAVMVGCVVNLAIVRLAERPIAAAWATIAVTFVIRVASVRLGLRTTTVPGVYVPPERPN